MKTLLILITLFLFLSGCATDKVLLEGSGVYIPPMPQAVTLCKEHPELEICKHAPN